MKMKILVPPGSQGGCGGTSFPSRPGPAPPSLLPFPPPQVVAPKDLPFQLSHKQRNLLAAPISSAPGGLHDETASLHSGSQVKQINVRCICCRLNIWKSHFINIFFPQRHPHMAASSGPSSQRCRRPQAYVLNVHSGFRTSVPGLPGTFQSNGSSTLGDTSDSEAIKTGGAHVMRGWPWR